MLRSLLGLCTIIRKGALGKFKGGFCNGGSFRNGPLAVEGIIKFP